PRAIGCPHELRRRIAWFKVAERLPRTRSSLELEHRARDVPLAREAPLLGVVCRGPDLAVPLVGSKAAKDAVDLRLAQIDPAVYLANLIREGVGMTVDVVGAEVDEVVSTKL